MGHWLVDPEKTGQAVHLAGFAPACRRQARIHFVALSTVKRTHPDSYRGRQMPIASVVRGKCKKNAE